MFSELKIIDWLCGTDKAPQWAGSSTERQLQKSGYSRQGQKPRKIDEEEWFISFHIYFIPGHVKPSISSS
jgi:hypothetical protein